MPVLNLFPKQGTIENNHLEDFEVLDIEEL